MKKFIVLSVAVIVCLGGVVGARLSEQGEQVENRHSSTEFVDIGTRVVNRAFIAHVERRFVSNTAYTLVILQNGARVEGVLRYWEVRNELMKRSDPPPEDE